MIKAYCEGDFIVLSAGKNEITMTRTEALSLRNDINESLREQTEHRMAVMDAETATNKAKAKRAKGEA